MIVVLAALCLTTTDINNAECSVACRNAGYDGGTYVEHQAESYCRCFDYKRYDSLLQKKAVLNPRAPVKGKFFNSDTDY